MSSVSPAELAAVTRRRHNVRIDAQLAQRFLADWVAAGVVEEVLPGRFRLTERGAAMFQGWVEMPLELDDEEVVA